MAAHRFDLAPSPVDVRDASYAMGAPAGIVLPDHAILSHLPPIKDQGQEGSCTGFSLSSAREALLGADRVELSPAFIYYEERRLERDDDQDAGANLRDGCKVLHKLGVCPEDVFPYVAGEYTRPTPPGAFDAAAGYKIASYHRIGSLKSAQAALVADSPVVLGIAVWESFEAVGADGLVPMPGPGEQMLGGHAILAVGYRKDKSRPGGGDLVLHNSWSATAGDGGRFYLPYLYAMHRETTFEMWTLR